MSTIVVMLGMFWLTADVILWHINWGNWKVFLDYKVHNYLPSGNKFCIVVINVPLVRYDIKLIKANTIPDVLYKAERKYPIRRIGIPQKKYFFNERVMVLHGYSVVVFVKKYSYWSSLSSAFKWVNALCCLQWVPQRSLVHSRAWRRIQNPVTQWLGRSLLCWNWWWNKTIHQL